MTASEESKMKLYDKMYAEQQRYRDWLLCQPPKEILFHAYEYSIREDILLAVDSMEFTAEQTTALLRSEEPLKAIYQLWEKRDCDYMEEMLATVENYADSLMQSCSD